MIWHEELLLEVISFDPKFILPHTDFALCKDFGEIRHFIRNPIIPIFGILTNRIIYWLLHDLSGMVIDWGNPSSHAFFAPKSKFVNTGVNYYCRNVFENITSIAIICFWRQDFFTDLSFPKSSSKLMIQIFNCMYLMPGSIHVGRIVCSWFGQLISS